MLLYISGPDLLLQLAHPTMVTSPTGKGVIVMGGIKQNRRASKAIFELSASMEWSRLEQTLQIGHIGHLAIPILDELIHEKNQSKNKQGDLEADFSKKPNKKILSAIAGKLNLNVIIKNSNLNFPSLHLNFFDRFLRKIRL